MKRYILKTLYLAVLAVIITSCNDREIPSVAANLPAVSNLQYALNGDSVKLTWTLPQGHDSLVASIASNDVTVSIPKNPTSYTFGIVEVNKDYGFTVKIKDNKGNISLGQTIHFTRTGAQPITNLRAEENDNGILLKWKLPAEAISGIKLTYGTQVINLAGTDSTYQVTNVTEPTYMFGLVTSNSANKVSNTVYLKFNVKLIGFLGAAADSLSIVNSDEKAAATWIFQNYHKARYISFNAIKNGSIDLSKFSVIWWHLDDNSQNLPDISKDPACIGALKTYYAAGGNFFFTTFACEYIEQLMIPNDGRKPNNIFGDTNPWVEQNWPWGISFKGHASHPLFTGLTLTTDKSDPTAYLLDKGAARLNHSCVWNLDSWGGYGNNDPQVWRDKTGGIDLCSTEWDADHTHVITIAEFPSKAGSGKTICIGSGAYDWYSENGTINQFVTNVKKITANGINYLK
jgi:hypothetical protein